MKKYLVHILILSSVLVKAQSIQSFTDSLLRQNEMPEIGFAVISTDSIIDLQVFGFHRTDLRNEQTKANLSDYFHLGSNTKAITGFIAAYLIENKKITWTTKFFDLFPEWKSQSNPAYYEITLADLLSHRARIQPYTSGLEYEELPDFKGDKSDQRKQFARYLLIEKPVKNRTKIYNYSNGGYSIAALMLEKASGKTWEQLTKEILLDKANLHIEFGWPNKLGENQPYGHWIVNDTLKALPPDLDYNLALGEPAGDISMTLPDYAKYILLNLQGLSGKDNILKTGTYEYLHFGLKDYAIGWVNVNEGKTHVSKHAGSAGTFFSYTLIDKRNRLAFIIVANSATERAQLGVFQLLERLRREYRSN